MKESNPRKLLARLRSGDYAHPGDTEVIDIFLKGLDKLQKPPYLHILDVGCGRGGTANYLRNKLSKTLSITGIDIDETALSEAKDKYRAIDFIIGDVCEINKLINNKKFDLICLFSIFYALSTQFQRKSLKKLSGIAQEGAILAICDYIRFSENRIVIHDFSGNVMNPPSMEDFKIGFYEAGWELLDVLDLSGKYHEWYDEFLEKLKTQRSELLFDFTDKTLDTVESTFQSILKKIDKKTWGAGIFYARLIKKPTDLFMRDLR